MTSSDISGDLTSCQPILVRELSWDFIGLTLEQIKAQDFSDYPLLCSDLLLKRILLTSYGAVVLYKSTEWDGTPRPWYPIIVNFSTNFYICTSGAISKINESAQK